RLLEAREQARQKGLAKIKSIAEADADWRGIAEWLRLSFQADYWQPNTRAQVNANAQAGTVAVTEAKRQELIERLKRLRSQWATETARAIGSEPRHGEG